jgi:acetoin utilization protein AcuB
MKALDIMKTNKIKRLPVMKGGKFVGLVTRAMLRDASPSDATSLSIHELNYLISRMSVSDIMVKNPVTISPDMPVEETIRLGNEKGIGAFPVMENDKLVGIITESDMSWIVAHALGVDEPDSGRISIASSGRRFGFLKELVEVLDEHQIPMMSILTVPKSDKGDWYMIVRVKAKDAQAAAEDLKKKGFTITDVT